MDASAALDLSLSCLPKLGLDASPRAMRQRLPTALFTALGRDTRVAGGTWTDPNAERAHSGTFDAHPGPVGVLRIVRWRVRLHAGTPRQRGGVRSMRRRTLGRDRVSPRATGLGAACTSESPDGDAGRMTGTRIPDSYGRWVGVYGISFEIRRVSDAFRVGQYGRRRMPGLMEVLDPLLRWSAAAGIVRCIGRFTRMRRWRLDRPQQEDAHGARSIRRRSMPGTILPLSRRWVELCRMQASASP